jgi:hypothetical protein
MLSVNFASGIAHEDSKFNYQMLGDYGRPSYIAALMTFPLLVWFLTTELFKLRNFFLHLVAGIIVSILSVQIFAYREIYFDRFDQSWSSAFPPFVWGLLVPSTIVGVLVGAIGWATIGKNAGVWQLNQFSKAFCLLSFCSAIIAATIFFKFVTLQTILAFSPVSWPDNIIYCHMLSAILGGAIFGIYLEWVSLEYRPLRQLLSTALLSTVFGFVFLSVAGKLWDFYEGPTMLPYWIIIQQSVGASVFVTGCVWGVEKIRQSFSKTKAANEMLK